MSKWTNSNTLTGHSENVFAIYDPDGVGLIVCCDADGTINILDMNCHEYVTLRGYGQRISEQEHTDREPVTGHTGLVTTITFDPNDSTHLASGSMDKTIRIWKDGQCVNILRGHIGWVNSVAFDSTGTRLASGSDNSAILIWDMKTYKPIITLQDTTSISCLLFDSSSLLFSGSSDGTIRIWDMKTYECVAVLRGHTDLITFIALDKSSSCLASSSRDKKILIWENNSKKMFQLFLGLFGPKDNHVFDPNRSLDRVAKNYSRILDPNAVGLISSFL